MRKRLLSFGMGLVLLSAAHAESDYVYILTGQSNSLGAVKGSPATPEQLKRYESEGLLWSGNMERDSGRTFDKSPSWQKVQPQLPEYNGSLCMGPEYGFAHMMQRRGWHSGARIRIIKASLDGGGNSFWLPGKPAYVTLCKTINGGLAALKGKPHVQALLYLQGESDKGEEISLAPARFEKLKANLQKEVKRGLKYAVVGQCATWFKKDTEDDKGNTTAGLMYALAQKKKKEIGWVYTRDLSKITSGDNMGVHYDGLSQITIGARFAYAVATLEKLPFGFVRGDTPERPLDSGSAWWGGKPPRESDVITWDISSCRGGDSLNKGLIVAGVRVEDPGAGKVSLAGKKSAVLKVGSKGIELKEGDLEISCRLVTAADQTWTLGDCRTLKISKLEGSGAITVIAPPSATLELNLSSDTAQEWILPQEMPQVKATINGKPAEFVKQGDTYKLKS